MSTVTITPRVSAAHTTASDGGYLFAVDRVEHVDPGDPTGDFTAFELRIDPPGEVEVVRSGSDGLGPWGVDIYRPSGQGITVDEARLWAHAILAAADLAEQLEHAEAEQPC